MRLLPGEEAETDEGQPEGEPSASGQSALETSEHPASLSSFSVRVAAYAGRFDAQRQTLLDTALHITDYRSPVLPALPD